jgi:hypothetical protein
VSLSQGTHGIIRGVYENSVIQMGDKKMGKGKMFVLAQPPLGKGPLIHEEG